MTTPVRFQVEPAARMDRLHVAIRLVLLLALGTLGCSSLYWLLYLALPAVAALLIASKGGERYLTEDAPRIIDILGWLARAYAYLWLLTDEAPSAERTRVELRIEPQGAPTAGGALARLLYSLPALLLLGLISFVASFAWLIGAIAILVSERLPRPIASFLELTLRYQFRLVAYHLSLVDGYPSFEKAPPAQLSHSGIAQGR